MVASSAQAVKRLVERCEFRSSETRTNNGVLIGKGHPNVIYEEGGPNIKIYLTLNNIHIREIPHMATMYRMHFCHCTGFHVRELCIKVEMKSVFL